MPGPPTWSKTAVDAAGRELAHARRDVLGAVVDGDRAERAQLLVLGRARRADDAHAGVHRELDEQRADAAGRAEHDDGLPGLHARAAVQHPPRRHAVDDRRLGRHRVEPRGDRHEVARVEQHAVGPAADLGERGDPHALATPGAPRRRRAARPCRRGRSRARTGTAAGRSSGRGASAARRRRRPWPRRGRAPGRPGGGELALADPQGLRGADAGELDLGDSHHHPPFVRSLTLEEDSSGSYGGCQ